MSIVLRFEPCMSFFKRTVRKIARPLMMVSLSLALAACGGGSADPPSPGSVPLAADANALTAVSASADPSTPALVLNKERTKAVASAAAAPAGGPAEADVIRSRAVDLDLAVLPIAGDAAGAGGSPASRLSIGFFDDATILVEITRTETTSSGGVAYTGVVPGVPDSMVVLVDNQGVVSMSVMSSGAQYTLRGSPGNYVARQVRPRELPPHPSEPPVINADPLPVPKVLGGSRAAEIARDDGSSIDVMVVYTPAARLQNGGTPQIEANIDAEVALTNAVYVNSNVVQRLRLVHKGEVDYTEVDMDTDLPRLADPSDSHLDEVPVLRDIYQADIVSLWGVYNDYCGLGYLMASESSGFARAAYNTVNSPLCTGAGAGSNGLTFAHELGHNMGLDHDAFVAPSNTTVTPEAGGGLTTITYAHGYVDLANRFRTVMSYSDQCSRAGFSCLRIPRFSNPALSFDNRAFYAASEPAPTGTANANERQALNDTRETVANFRTARTTLSGPGVAMFLPVDYRVGEGAGTVQVKVARHLGSTGAVSVDYATVNGTAVGGTNYASASGTLTWAAGDTTVRTITLALSQDTISDGDKTFTIVLSNPTGGVSIGSLGSSTMSANVTMVDDDPDNFPAGCVLPAGWIVPPGAVTGWSVSSESFDGMAGQCSLKSNAMANAASGTPNKAQIQYTGVFVEGNITFRRRVSSERGFDCFRLLIDGVQKSVGGTCTSAGGIGASGEVPWTVITVPVTGGTHTLTWSYEKDMAVSSGSDAAWIDSVRLPIAPSAPRITSIEPGVYAGSVSIAFNPPANPGGSGITAYAASCSATGRPSRSATGAGSPLIVAGLVPGLAYDCTVAASNSFGAGSSSAIVAGVNASRLGIDTSGDFNGDGKPDLLFENTVTGDRLFWLMDGANYSSSASLGNVPVSWQISGTGEFNGDGKPDILWQNLVTGERVIWFMNGTAPIGIVGLGIVPVVWRIVGAGDFNGDGKSDILWQNRESGQPVVWLMNGSVPLGAASLGDVSPEWSLATAGDFNADGKPDLLWQNTLTGERYIWFMDGMTYAASASLGVIPVEWSIVSSSDFSGDGTPDILWQNTVTGERFVWVMNGPVPLYGVVVGRATPDWSLAR